MNHNMDSDLGITEMLEKITNAKDKKMSTVAVFIDLKKV